MLTKFQVNHVFVFNNANDTLMQMDFIGTMEFGCCKEARQGQDAQPPTPRKS